MPCGNPGQSQWGRTKTHLSHTQAQTIKVSIGTFCLACIPELSQLFWPPADVNTVPPRRLLEMPLSNACPTLAPNKKSSNSRLPELAAGTAHSKVNGTLTLILKDPEIETVLEPETICWKNQLSKVMNDSQKPQPSWKRVLSPNVNEGQTHTQKYEQTQQKWARRYREQGSGHHREEVVDRRKGTWGHLYGDRWKLNFECIAVHIEIKL